MPVLDAALSAVLGKSSVNVTGKTSALSIISTLIVFVALDDGLTFTPLAAASDEICVTVLITFVLSTVLLLTPVIVSV